RKNKLNRECKCRSVQCDNTNITEREKPAAHKRMRSAQTDIRVSKLAPGNRKTFNEKSITNGNQHHQQSTNTKADNDTKRSSISHPSCRLHKRTPADRRTERN